MFFNHGGTWLKNIWRAVLLMVRPVSESCFSSLVMSATVYSRYEKPPTIFATAFMLLFVKGDGIGSSFDVGRAFGVIARATSSPIR